MRDWLPTDTVVAWKVVPYIVARETITPLGMFNVMWTQSLALDHARTPTAEDAIAPPAT